MLRSPVTSRTGNDLHSGRQGFEVQSLTEREQRNSALGGHNSGSLIDQHRRISEPVLPVGARGVRHIQDATPNTNNASRDGTGYLRDRRIVAGDQPSELSTSAVKDSLEGVIQTNAPDPAANGNATYAPTNLKASQDYGHQTSLFTQSATEREGKRIQLLSHRYAYYGYESQMTSSSGSNPAPSNVPGPPSTPRMDAAFSQAQLATVIPTQHPLNRDTSEPVLPVGARGVHTNNNKPH